MDEENRCLSPRRRAVRPACLSRGPRAKSRCLSPGVFIGASGRDARAARFGERSGWMRPQSGSRRGLRPRRHAYESATSALSPKGGRGVCAPSRPPAAERIATGSSGGIARVRLDPNGRTRTQKRTVVCGCAPPSRTVNHPQWWADAPARAVGRTGRW
jgi:hypothetical protein